MIQQTRKDRYLHVTDRIAVADHRRCRHDCRRADPRSRGDLGAVLATSVAYETSVGPSADISIRPHRHQLTGAIAFIVPPNVHATYEGTMKARFWDQDASASVAAI